MFVVAKTCANPRVSPRTNGCHQGICPGITNTEIIENQLNDLARTHGINRDEVLEKAFFPDIPQKRVIGPQETADTVLFLCSEKAQAITGQAINVSAGWVMQ